MHHPVPDRGDPVAAGQVRERGAHRFQGRTVICNPAQFSSDSRGLLRLPQLQTRVQPADALDLAACRELKRAIRFHRENGELDAGRAGVDDQDRIA